MDYQGEIAGERLLPSVANWHSGPDAVRRHPSTYGRYVVRCRGSPLRLKLIIPAIKSRS